MRRDDHGTLIAFEGIDGAGKTTQVGLLVEFFASAGEPVVHSKEPTGGPWGQKIRQSATNGRMALDEELRAFVEDRKEHVRDVILPALAQGKTVILDRYFYSTIAYQGTAGLDPEDIALMMREISPEPDAVILLDVYPAVGLARIEEGRREKPNAFETNGNLAKVRQAFLRLADQRQNIVRIDGTPDVETVRRRILKELLDGALKRRHCAKAYGCDDPLLCAYRMTNTCRWVQLCRQAGPVS